MSTLIKNKNLKAINVWFSKDMIYIKLEDGRELGIPLDWYPKLRDASKKELENWRFIGKGIGIHWESLDEDLSIRGLLN